MAFNENSRVKIPALIHLERLGYTYLSLSKSQWDIDTNIFVDVFNHSLKKINPSITDQEINNILTDIKLKLNFEDLGKEFYRQLTGQSGYKLVDFKNFENNSFHVVTELTCKNGDEEFRPDITVLINGIPLVFIEVKKPNNEDGVLSERKRINERYKNPKFRRFANITQMMIFSNNMEYDDNEIQPYQGAYYATSAYSDLHFNYFREEEQFNLSEILKSDDEVLENSILKDNNLNAIKYSEEFKTNKNPDSSTNRILTSLLKKDRLAFILKYALAYVKESKGAEKHIMRYPQIFATKAIETKLNEGIKKGIIWHTQGSGKTALAFYNVKHLTDIYQQKGIIPKFYFIVDRLDLAIQASREFSSRDLIVKDVDSRQGFIKDIQTVGAIHNDSGKSEITVVNIQKFTEDTTVIENTAYHLHIQRIYFLDEVHRSYNPRGSFLANLINSDKNAIIIGLTGTPLITKNLYSKSLFGDYIHKYYYNRSIADGYTLKLIREGIDTSYKIQLQEILNEIDVLKGDLDRRQIFAHPKYVKPMLDYILKDFNTFRNLKDNTVGAMVVCDSSEQAKEMFNYFESIYGIQRVTLLPMAAEEEVPYGENPQKRLTAALILHDVNTKSERKDQVEDYKDGKIDILFVYNMLLTGFDAKRLKKLYLGRVIKDHNLLQTLTRVNRPYKTFRYGYVVDFADIRAAFDKTNREYFDELQEELGDEMQFYSDIFKSKEEIESDLLEIKETLFRFDTKNAEIFRQQISDITSREEVIKVLKALNNAKELKNIIRLFGYEELLAKLDFFKLSQLQREAQSHLNALNDKAALANPDTTNILNIALEDVIFMFRKVSEDELVLADRLKEQLRKTRETLLQNFDTTDPEFVSLKEELERMFKKKNLDEISQTEMNENIVLLNQIYEKVKELNRKNALLAAKYEADEKYARVHKRILENKDISAKESQLHEALMGVKLNADDDILKNKNLMQNESYFNQYLLRLVFNEFKQKQNLPIDAATTKNINTLIVKEYLKDYSGVRA
jgi:type I restriction enzyme, R subunit